MLSHRHARRRGSRGLTMVEVLVGVAIGLVLVSGVISLFVTNLVNSRRMLVEARLNQDMRAASDLIARDLRRAAYWENSIQGTRVFGTNTAPTRNPYQSTTPDTATSSILYTFSRDLARGVAENDSIDDVDERFGFRLNGGVVQMRTSLNTWQDVTDPGVMTVTSLALAVEDPPPLSMSTACARTCTIDCPVLRRRVYQLVMTAQAVSDSAVVRRLETRARIRNDRLDGICPAA